jgi:hypothetical protein
MKAKLAAAVSYCLLHKKQLSAALALGAALLEAIQKAH